jgi:predicted NBD/HSP70 family sugar kinase
MQITGDQQLLKDINRVAVVRHLCGHPGLSRAAVAEALGLTKSTVSLLVRELMDDGWLVEREVVATGELGRRPTPLFINPGRLVLMGAEVGLEGVLVVATSLTGEVLARAQRPYGKSSGKANEAQAGLAMLGDMLLDVQSRLDSRAQEVIGIGVGLPGGVDEASGHLHFAPNLRWRNVAAGALLAAHLRRSTLNGVPLFLQNDADVAALGEFEFAGQARRPDPLVYLSVSQGVGAGVIVDDRLLTGAHGFAGEVGHTILQLDGPLCSCGRNGCAESLIGFRAMLPTAKNERQVPATLQTIQQQLQRKHAETHAAVQQAGRYLGMLLQNLTAAYDPGCIVLGGAAVELGDAFLEPALHTLRRYAADAGLTPPPVEVARFGADAVAIGAAALARYRLTRPLMPNNSIGDSGP